MSSQPECMGCGLYVHSGPCLCDACAKKREAEIARLRDHWESDRRFLRAANEEIARLRAENEGLVAKLSCADEGWERWRSKCEELERRLAAAEFREGALEGRVTAAEGALAVANRQLGAAEQEGLAHQQAAALAEAERDRAERKLAAAHEALKVSAETAGSLEVELGQRLVASRVEALEEAAKICDEAAQPAASYRPDDRKFLNALADHAKFCANRIRQRIGTLDAAREPAGEEGK